MKLSDALRDRWRQWRNEQTLRLMLWLVRKVFGVLTIRHTEQGAVNRLDFMVAGMSYDDLMRRTDAGEIAKCIAAAQAEAYKAADRYAMKLRNDGYSTGVTNCSACGSRLPVAFRGDVSKDDLLCLRCGARPVEFIEGEVAV